MIKRSIIFFCLCIYSCNNASQPSDEFLLIGEWEVLELLICSYIENETCSECFNGLDPESPQDINCEGDWCDMFIYINDTEMYWNHCAYADVFSQEECKDYSDSIPADLVWFSDTNSCGWCQLSPEYSILSLDDETICLNDQEGDYLCTPITFSNGGNSAFLQFILEDRCYIIQMNKNY